MAVSAAEVAASVVVGATAWKACEIIAGGGKAVKFVPKIAENWKNFFTKLKENRRLVLRFEQSDICFLVFIALATIKYNLC